MNALVLSPWSPEMRIMFRPAAAYRQLSELSAATGRWLAVRRPALYAFVLGCTVSFVATGRLTLRLAIPATIYTGLEVLIQLISLAAVRPKSSPTLPSFRRSLDLYFAGFGPWLLWLLVFAAVWAFASPVQAFRWGGPRWNQYVIAVLVIWSAYIDFCFFRIVFRVQASHALVKLLVQRLISWSLAALIFGGGSLAPELMRSLHV